MSVVDGMVQFNDKPLLLLITAFGAALSRVVVAEVVEVQPLAPVTTTENDPAVETVMKEVVAPVLQL